MRKTSLKMHMMIHAVKTIKCPHCDFLTQYKQTLKGHMRRLHSLNVDGTEAVRPHACDMCSKAFFSRQQLRYHKMRHTGEKPHLCPICDFRTIDKGSMNMHVRTHTGAMPYRCEHCEKHFKQSSALSWHIKTVHLGHRRYNCKDCDKAYVNKKDLRAHRFSKHLYIKPFSCALCNYSCTKKEYMVSHIEKFHGPDFVPADLKGIKNVMNSIDKFEGEQGDNDEDLDNGEAGIGQVFVPMTTAVQLSNSAIRAVEHVEMNHEIPLMIVPDSIKELMIDEPDSDDEKSADETAATVEYRVIENQSSNEEHLTVKYESGSEREKESDSETPDQLSTDISFNKSERENLAAESAGGSDDEQNVIDEYVTYTILKEEDANETQSASITEAAPSVSEDGTSAVDTHSEENIAHAEDNVTEVVTHQLDEAGNTEQLSEVDTSQLDEVNTELADEEERKPDIQEVSTTISDIQPDIQEVATIISDMHQPQETSDDLLQAEVDQKDEQLRYDILQQAYDEQQLGAPDEQHFVELTPEQLQLSGAQLADGQHVVLLADGKHLVLQPGQEHLVLADGEQQLVLDEQGQQHLVLEQGQQHIVLEQGEEHLILDQSHQHLILEQGQQDFLLEQSQQDHPAQQVDHQQFAAQEQEQEQQPLLEQGHAIFGTGTGEIRTY